MSSRWQMQALPQLPVVQGDVPTHRKMSRGGTRLDPWSIHPGRQTVACRPQHASGHSVVTSPVPLRARLNLMPWMRYWSQSPPHHAWDGIIPRHHRVGSLCYGNGFQETSWCSKRTPPTLSLHALSLILDFRSDHTAATSDALPVDLQMRSGTRLEHRHTHLCPQRQSAEGNWSPVDVRIRRPGRWRQVSAWMQLWWAGHNKWGATGVLASCHPGGPGGGQAMHGCGQIKTAAYLGNHQDKGIVLTHMQYLIRGSNCNAVLHPLACGIWRLLSVKLV